MPRPIKKKAQKPAKAEAENELKGLLSRTGERLSGRLKLVVVAASAAAIMAMAVLGYGLYARSLKGKAEGFFYEGYKNYHALYEAEKLVKADRLNRSLEGFKKSYETKANPIAIYYMAAALDALGRPDEALSALDELMREFPGDEEFGPLALYKKASIEMRKGDNAGALKSFEALASLGTASYKDLALFESARLLELQGKRHEAIAKYLSIAENFPTSPYAEAAKQRAGLTNTTGAPGGGKETGNEGGGGGQGVANQPQR